MVAQFVHLYSAVQDVLGANAEFRAAIGTLH